MLVQITVENVIKGWKGRASTAHSNVLLLNLPPSLTHLLNKKAPKIDINDV
jgi:hypothetical protein